MGNPKEGQWHPWARGSGDKDSTSPPQDQRASHRARGLGLDAAALSPTLGSAGLAGSCLSGCVGASGRLGGAILVQQEFSISEKEKEESVNV